MPDRSAGLAAPFKEACVNAQAELKTANATANDDVPTGASGAAAANHLVAQWVKLTTAIDALRSLLEDSYVDRPDGLMGRIQAALANAEKNPTGLVALAREIANLEPLTPNYKPRRITTPNVRARYLLRVAPKDKPGFLMSTREVRKLPVLDDSITDPTYCEGVCAAYVDAIRQASARQDVSYLVFIDKNFGPVGALGMISQIVRDTGLPATIYRERKWSKKTDFTGHHPEKEERGIIVYDLLNTGTAIRNAAERVFERFESNVVAAAILYNTSPSIQIVDIHPHGNLDKDGVIIYSLDGDEGFTKISDLLDKPNVNRAGREIAPAGAKGDSRSLPKGQAMSVQSKPTLRSLQRHSKYSTDEDFEKVVIDAERATAPIFEKIREQVLRDWGTEGRVAINVATGGYVAHKDRVELIRLYNRKFGTDLGYTWEIS